MRYSLRTDQFCALSSDKIFHQWLLEKDEEIYAGLQSHLSRSTGCKSNKGYMKFVRKQLSSKGLTNDLVEFLRNYFPTVLKPIAEKEVKMDISDLNKHNVFRSYKPHILTFPHKYIIVNKDKDKLMLETIEFIKDKIGADYIMIEDRSYIEYFEPRFRKESEEIPKENRDIWLYRKKNK
jgi:hypothetical protein